MPVGGRKRRCVPVGGRKRRCVPVGGRKRRCVPVGGSKLNINSKHDYFCNISSALRYIRIM